jgi:hypothetical protein
MINLGHIFNKKTIQFGINFFLFLSIFLFAAQQALAH